MNAVIAFFAFNIFVTEFDITYTTTIFILNVLFVLVTVWITLRLSLPTARWGLNRHIRRVLREALGDLKHYRFDITLADEGIVTSMIGIENKIPWQQVTCIEAQESWIEIDSKPGGLILVRDRAFSSAREKQEFLSRLQQYASEATL